MAQLSPMAAASHQRPPHPPPFPLPPCSCSSSAVLFAIRIYPSSDIASSSSSVSSSLAFSSPRPFCPGRKRRGAANAYICFREESAPYPSLHLRLWLASPRDPSCSLSCEQARNGSLGWWRKRTVGAACCGGTGVGGQVGVKQVKQELGNKEDESILDLEAEIYEFMQKSAKPSDFPTKEELIAAGRVDLVEAIVAYGGWLAYGWDLDDGGASDADDDEEKRERVCGGELRADAINSPMPEAKSATMEHNEPSAHQLDKEIIQQQRETKGGEESGIEGILSRLEKERSSIFMVGSNDKGLDSKVLSKIKDYDLGSAAGETFPNRNVNKLENLNDIPMDGCAYPVDWSASDPDMRNGSKEPGSGAVSDQNPIHSRLQYLELELASVLSSLRSRADAVVSQKSEESLLKELHRLSDAWEFQENEIMNAHDKLRSTRAKLAVLEGKMALEIIEAQKIVEEKQKRIDAAQRALRLLRTAYVVWPNSASEVLLAGSFDGWISQKRMERSSTGIFSLSLKLYPGQYEIKFIVDGVWKIDPLRPIVYNNGFENNLLIIS